MSPLNHHLLLEIVFLFELSFMQIPLVAYSAAPVMHSRDRVFVPFLGRILLDRQRQFRGLSNRSERAQGCREQFPLGCGLGRFLHRFLPVPR